MLNNRSDELDSQTHFTRAIKYLRAGNEPEALAAFSRLLQLTPGHEQANAARQKLATELGLAELDQAARVIENFVYAQCGPGYGWKVELREMYQFRPNQPPLTMNAVVLDLCQAPQAFIQLIIMADDYEVSLMVEKPIPGVARTTLSQARTETVQAQPEKLLELLNRMVATGMLINTGNQLQYHGA